MDIELLSAVAPSIATNFYHVTSNSSLKQGWVLQLLSTMNNEESPALVVSISYGKRVRTLSHTRRASYKSM